MSLRIRMVCLTYLSTGIFGCGNAHTAGRADASVGSDASSDTDVSADRRDVFLLSSTPRMDRAISQFPHPSCERAWTTGSVSTGSSESDRLMGGR